MCIDLLHYLRQIVALPEPIVAPVLSSTIERLESGALLRKGNAQMFRHALFDDDTRSPTCMYLKCLHACWHRRRVTNHSQSINQLPQTGRWHWPLQTLAEVGHLLHVSKTFHDAYNVRAQFVSPADHRHVLAFTTLPT